MVVENVVLAVMGIVCMEREVCGLGVEIVKRKRTPSFVCLDGHEPLSVIEARLPFRLLFGSPEHDPSRGWAEHAPIHDTGESCLPRDGIAKLRNDSACSLVNASRPISSRD